MKLLQIQANEWFTSTTFYSQLSSRTSAQRELSSQLKFIVQAEVNTGVQARISFQVDLEIGNQILSEVRKTL